MTKLTPDALAALTYQTYPPQEDIEGAWQQALVKHHAGNGAFMECLRLDEHAQTQGTPNAHPTRQVSVSWAEAHRVNAFHIHPNSGQSELWTVIAGQLSVWLVDCRQDGATSGHKRKFTLNGEQPTQLHIPGGVAHGYKAGPHGATLLYATSHQFNAQQPDEGRLPWNFLGDGLWDDDRG